MVIIVMTMMEMMKKIKVAMMANDNNAQAEINTGMFHTLGCGYVTHKSCYYIKIWNLKIYELFNQIVIIDLSKICYEEKS